MSVKFDELLRAEIRSYERGSWTGTIGETEVTIYAKPITPKDHDMMRRAGYENFLMNIQVGAMALLISEKAEDEHGTTVFGPKVLPLLQRLSQDKITSIFSELFKNQVREALDPALEDRKGN